MVDNDQTPKPGLTAGKKFKSKDTLSSSEVADMLESIALRVRSGNLALTQGAAEIEFDLPGAFKVELEVEDKVKGENASRKVELELEWQVDADGNPADAGDGPAELTVL